MRNVKSIERSYGFRPLCAQVGESNAEIRKSEKPVRVHCIGPGQISRFTLTRWTKDCSSAIRSQTNSLADRRGATILRFRHGRLHALTPSESIFATESCSTRSIRLIFRSFCPFGSSIQSIIIFWLLLSCVRVCVCLPCRGVTIPLTHCH